MDERIKFLRRLGSELQERKGNVKHRPIASLTVHRNLPLMLLDNAVADRKAQPSPFSYTFRGKEWIEDAAQIVRRDTCAAIVKDYFDRLAANVAS